MKRVAILGSTGSVGTQALDVIRRHRGDYEVIALAAGRNTELLAQQAAEFDVDPKWARTAVTTAMRSPSSPRTPRLTSCSTRSSASRACRRRSPHSSTGTRLALANKESLIAGVRW